MTKYIKLDDALADIDKLWEYATADDINATAALRQVKADLQNLPAIELIDDETREFCKGLHPTWDSGYAVGFNDGRRSAENNDKAEWVKVDKSGLRCSKCGSISRNRGGTKIPKHCPECGTKTIGVE